MIKCNAKDGCREWYHYQCEDLGPALVAHIKRYACRGCRRADLATTSYKGVENHRMRKTNAQHSTHDAGQRRARVESNHLEVKVEAAHNLVNDNEANADDVAGADNDGSPQPVPRLQVADYEEDDDLINDEEANADDVAGVDDSGADGGVPRLRIGNDEEDINAPAIERVGNAIHEGLNLAPGQRNIEEHDSEGIVPSIETQTWPETLQRRLNIVTLRHQEIHAELGARQVAQMSVAEIDALRAHPVAVGNFLQARIDRVIAQQNADVAQLADDVDRLPAGSRPDADYRRMFGWVPGPACPE